MRYRNSFQIATYCVLLVGSAMTATAVEWQSHTVQRLNGAAPASNIPAKLQIVTQNLNRAFTVPNLIYMPEQDRLLMTVLTDYPRRAVLMSSDDHGNTWSDARFPHVDAQGSPDASGTALTYLGQGKVILAGGTSSRWFSQDYGTTWGDPVPVGPTPDGKTWNGWDSMLVERSAQTGAVTRLTETGYAVLGTPGSGPGYEQAYFRSSADEGRTWTSGVQVPQWQGVSEVNILRAANGDLVATCRTDISNAFPGETMDHLEGLGVSISKDGGSTWSDVSKLYDYGRHHASMLLMPNNDIVMTYVVRKGYADTADGFPQFGIEAVVSHDNGTTWDMDHRYILDTWVGNRPSSDANAWWASPAGESSVLMPDGSILTAFGTGFRSQPGTDGNPIPMDVGLVQWRLAEAPEPSGFIIAATGLLGWRLHAWLKRRPRHSRFAPVACITTSAPAR
jgi:hypothetical protein